MIEGAGKLGAMTINTNGDEFPEPLVEPTEGNWRHKRVLDHGYVALRDSMPHWSGELSETGLEPCDARIVEAARVSYAPMELAPADRIALETQKLLATRTRHAMGKEPARTKEKDENLIRYLYNHEHMTPFEKVRLEFVAKLPIFVARQWVRHRAGSFNETSARYTELRDEFYVPLPERIKTQHKNNKQGSGEALERDVQLNAHHRIKEFSNTAYSCYLELLDAGVARELARMVLPTNIYTCWYWTVDLRNLFHFVHLRLDEHAQYEIRVYAEAILEMLRRVAPVATAAFEAKENGKELG